MRPAHHGSLTHARHLQQDPFDLERAPGMLDALAHTTPHGRLHDQFSVVGFAALVAACLLFAVRFGRRHRPGWAKYSAGTGILFVGAPVLATAGFNQHGGLTDVAGLSQRIMATTGWLWLSLLAAHELRRG